MVVLFFHTGYQFPHARPFGSFGVDIFFVISGYIMCRILASEPTMPAGVFLRRRLIRIVPPYWFFTLLVFFLAAYHPNLFSSTRANLAELSKSLFFIPFIKESGLFRPILFVGWTLNYEMFFYVVLALGALLWRKHAVAIGSFIILLAVFICSHLPSSNVYARFYGQNYLLEFLAGISSYHLAEWAGKKRRFLPPVILYLTVLACATSLIAVAGFFTVDAKFNAFIFSVPSFVLVLSMVLLSQSGHDARSRSLVLIGDASYVLYLMHPLSVYGINHYIGGHILWLQMQTGLGSIFAMVITVAIAILIHLKLERPLVKFLNAKYGGKRPSSEFSENIATPA